MKCPKCEKEMGVVWVAKPEEKRSIYELDDVQFCWTCGRLFLAVPESLDIQSSKNLLQNTGETPT